MLKIRNDGQTHMAAINLEGCTEPELREIAAHPAIHADVQEMAKIYLESRAARLAGNIERATRLERKADQIYDIMPRALRW